MKLSIILPTYNNEQTIDECLRSIACQDWPQADYEILVIDGGSTEIGRAHV
jgi:glycosyltransferase involved in cell wall biosynthesis